MAWVSTSPKEQQSDSSRELTGERERKEVYVVIYDAPTTSIAAETASGIPALGSSHPDDSSRKATKISAKSASEDTCRNIFEVTVEYSTSTIAENPLDTPDDIQWEGQTEDGVYFIDFSDTPKLTINSAGEPFAELLKNYDGAITATITRNIPYASPPVATLVQYINPCAVNTDSFTLDGISIAAGQARFCADSSISGKRTQNGVDYRVLTIKLAFKESWDDVVEDRGFNELNADGKPKEIVKGDPPTKVDTPWPLDGSGHAKTNGDDEPEELTFEKQPKLAFSAWSFA